MKQRILNILIGLDQFVWVVITLGKGSPDETISAALWRMECQGKQAGRWFRPVVDWMFSPLEKKHCYQAFLSEKRGTQQNPAYKTPSDQALFDWPKD